MKVSSFDVVLSFSSLPVKHDQESYNSATSPHFKPKLKQLFILVTKFNWTYKANAIKRSCKGLYSSKANITIISMDVNKFG